MAQAESERQESESGRADADESADSTESDDSEDEASDRQTDDRGTDEPSRQDQERSTADSGPERGRAKAFASPTVRRLARELGVDVQEVAASGETVSEGDVKAHVRERMRHGDRRGLGSDPDLPDFEAWGKVEREPMGAVRRKTAEIVRHSWQQIPQVTQFDRADVTGIEEFRAKHGEVVEAAGGRLTITAILIKVAAMALEAFPRFNASVDCAKAELVLKRFVNIGVAVDSRDGLLVPVLRGVGGKSLTEIAVELRGLSVRARAGKLGPDELQGASFTVTNLGSLGSAEFTPIVPWPQVAILAVGMARPEYVRHGGEFTERIVLPIGVSYDHRCIDGGDAARFLRWIAEVLEQPMRMTMETTAHD